MDPTGSYARNKKLIYIAIGFLLFGLLALLILGVAFFKQSKPDPNALKNTPTPTVSISSVPITLTPSILVNNDAHLFYIASNSLYRFNSYTKENISIDTSVEYESLYSFNEDNTYLAFKSSDGYLYFRDMAQSKNIRSIKVTSDGKEQFWSDAQTFVIVSGNSYVKYSAPNFTQSETKDFNFPATSDFISISPDLEWVLARESSRLERLYLFNINSAKIQYLELFDLDDEVAFNYLNWLPPHRLIFFNSIGLSALNPDSMVQTRLLSFNIDITTGDRLTPLQASSGSGNTQYFFSYFGRLYKYVEGTLINTQILDLKDYNFLNLDQIAISPNSRYASFDRSNGAAIVINLSTLSSLSLCDFDCYDPIWEN
jgi:hypothetical protein